MTISCEALESRYILEGDEILLSDPVLQQHLEECAHCRALYVTLTTIDEELTNAPEYDVPEHVVQQVLSKVTIVAVKARPKSRVSVDYPTLAGVVVIVGCSGYLLQSYGGEFGGPSGDQDLFSSVLTALEGTAGALLMLVSFLGAVILAGARRFKVSASLLTLSVCCFVVRSMQSTFFNDVGIQGGGGGPVKQVNTSATLRRPPGPVRGCHGVERESTRSTVPLLRHHVLALLHLPAHRGGEDRHRRAARADGQVVPHAWHRAGAAQ